MALVFERFFSEGIAAISYLVGDDRAGVAAVIDPTVDIGKYLDVARRKGVEITHLFETHIHADLVSGSLELQEAVRGAKIHLSHEGDARYGFDHVGVKDGDRFVFGDTVITARHTPGHTSEHLGFLLAEKDDEEMPWGVLSGDSLLVGSVGRPDLVGDEEKTEALTRQLFDTLRGFYLGLPDGVLVFPGHGQGSPCGARIGDRMESSVGYERRRNPFLQIADYRSFRAFIKENAPPVPNYYPGMKKVNARGPRVLGSLPRVPSLPPAAFRDTMEQQRAVVIDTRHMLGFGGGHIDGALNIEGSPLLSIWAGWLIERHEPILLVLESEAKLEEVLTLLSRTGYTNVIGYLAGGMTAWDNAGLPLARVGQMTVHEMSQAGGRLQIVDVRSAEEWESGHVPGAIHCFLPELRGGVPGLKKSRPVALYCGSGYRASIGASLLKQEGFREVFNVPGSWQAWKKADYPIETAGSRPAKPRKRQAVHGDA
ncbi:MAG: MBL fold metallo-hydrolase [Verrucomicrobiales bacterium]|nr:MBL fold metallo-hydrolase [Verrucomicrobiales bacterium]